MIHVFKQMLTDGISLAFCAPPSLQNALYYFRTAGAKTWKVLWPICANFLVGITDQGVLRGRVHSAPISGSLTVSYSLPVTPTQQRGRRPGRPFPALHTQPPHRVCSRHPVSTRVSSSSSRSTRVCPNLSSGPRSPFPSLRFISGRRTRGNHVPMVGVASTLRFPLLFLPLSSKKLRVSSPEPWTGRGTLRVCTESGLWSQSLRLRNSCGDGFVFWKHRGASVGEPPPPSASSSDITGLADEPYFQRKKFGLLVDINF